MELHFRDAFRSVGNMKLLYYFRRKKGENKRYKEKRKEETENRKEECV
jgi:hypothetical protein